MSRLCAVFARHTGHHRRHGSYSGWAGFGPVARFVRPVLDFVARRSPTPLGSWPLAKFDHSHPDLIPFSTPDYDTKPLEPTR